MPNLRDHQSSQTTKMLLIGDSGSGKTGAHAALADAGYNLRFLDFDNGLDVLTNVLLDPKSPYKKDSIDRIRYEAMHDRRKVMQGRLVSMQAEAWPKTLEMLDKFQVRDREGKVVEDLGPVWKWTPQDILVIDSLSFMASATMRWVMMLNNRVGQAKRIQDYGQAQELLTDFFEMLYDTNVSCNVIITSHLNFVGDGEGREHGYPNAIGKSLSSKIGRYFNTILMCKTEGSGTAAKHRIYTQTQGIVELKNSAPLRVKPSYGIEFGLAEYFKDVRAA